MNSRIIKGSMLNPELLTRLNNESIEDMQNQCDFAFMAVNAAKSRLQHVNDKLAALKAAMRNANRSYSKKHINTERFKKDFSKLNKLRVDTLYEKDQVDSALKQARIKYGNCRTLVFMLKSANLFIANATKEQA